MLVFGYAPFQLFPLPVFALAGLFALMLNQATPGRSALVGLCFGVGLFGAGVSWIYISLHEYGGMSVLLAVIATIGFCGFLALFYAAFGMVAWACRSRGTLLRIIALPACWVAFEWLRGVLFTGFPWLAVGYSQTAPSPLAGYAPVFGVYGISLLLAISAMLLLDCLSCWKNLKRWSTVLLFGIWTVGGMLQQMQWTSPAGAPFSVTLLQGNVPQNEKWRAENVAPTLQLYRSLLQRSSGRLIVMPETALPLFADELPAVYIRDVITHLRAAGADLIVGVPERVVDNDKVRYFNSAIGMGTSPTQTYRKQHLVPFGEYLPAQALLSWVLDFLHIPLADMSPGGPGQAPLSLAGQQVAVNICFEDVFGEEIIRAVPNATLLVNLSNLAWFGNSLALPQHLQIAQMRAMEAGRYMLRATNTGATAIIDQRGRVVQQAKPHRTLALSGMAQGFVGATPYVAAGNLPVLIYCGAGILLAFGTTARRYGQHLASRKRVRRFLS
ncbi:apolipoprotein N-acyltransferase [Pollutimonas sp. H1-120]|uniref:apolipoprotein N-acyltransferase n=1 Tax=Pollutimonas sp. H1-120 TaxID=3148824 RepID=UPI003B5172D9